MATLVVAVVFGLVGQFDGAVLRREQAVVEHGLAARSQEVAHMVVPQVVWDDAVRHLDNAYDAAWAKENIGQFLQQADGFSASFVLDRADQPIFASGSQVQPPSASFAPYAFAAEPLLADTRAAEAKRGPLGAPRRPGEMIAAPIQASALGRIGGKIYLMTATLVQPDFGTAALGGPKAPVVVTAMELDPGFLASFANRFMLRDLKLTIGARALARNEARADLIGPGGTKLAALTWRPQAPGASLLRNIIAPIFGVMSALGVAALVLFRHGRNATERLVASEARASHLAYHDALTGLPNRVLFFDRLGHALEASRRSGVPVAVHCIDLDRFKEVNDTYGHHVGDELIREAARRMAALCRGSDTFVRLSGDEFAIVQADASGTAAAALASRLVEAMSEPADLTAGRVFVGASIGVTLVTGGAIEGPEALRQADLALYRAKESGKSRYCFFEIEMDAAVKTRRGLEVDLREALRSGKLDLVYQPQVNRRDEIIGVESLLRWTHPKRGPISPAYFVRIAEECGLIAELGHYVMRRAFEDSRRWPGLKVAVNVSAAQVRSREFVDDVGELLSETCVDPHDFELEITEGVLLGDDPTTHENLKRLRHMGFTLALDDFGTGYSSLSYLRNYPINKIKIDRSFITNLGIDDEAEAVIAAIVRLGRALKLDVIAEGVESRQQRNRLSAAGCSEIQGFLFSKPVPAQDVAALLRAHVAAPAA